MLRSHIPMRAKRGAACLLAALLAQPGLAAGPRLVLISLDGLRADAVTPDAAPHLTALAAAGTHAREALDDLPPVTMTNHATMLTGLVAEVHGVWLDTELPGTIALPTLFDYAHAAGLRCAFFASKEKLRYFAPPEALETIDLDADQDALTQRVVAQLGPDGPAVIFAHLRAPDSVGHQSGWLSPDYVQAVSRADAWVGQIVAAGTADTSRGTYFIVTADHGGEGTTHILNDPGTRQVPWIVAGPDIPAGGELADTVALADTTPTALWLLGLAVPPGLSGRVRTDVKSGVATDLAPLPVAPLGLPCVLFTVPLLLALRAACYAAAGRGPRVTSRRTRARRSSTVAIPAIGRP